MPRMDLRHDDVTLNSVAPFKVLALMCHPNPWELVKRERMLGHIVATSGTGRPRRRPLTSEDFSAEVRISSLWGSVAGAMLLTLLQLHGNHLPASLNRAIPIVRSQLPKWTMRSGASWPNDSFARQWPRSSRKMLEAFSHYRAAAHLWAALIHGMQHNRTDIWPGSCQQLPIFLDYAECLLKMAAQQPAPYRRGKYLIGRNEAWTFRRPKGLIKERLLIAMPLNEAQVQLNE